MTMTIEQKAQRYDESLKRAKKLYEQGTITESLNYVFPELKESEDEQSRKWILEYLYDGLRRSDEQFKGQFKCAIAWLEKQVEQKSAWSEEDEQITLSIEQVMNCASLLNVVPEKIDKIKTWLKSLKQRIGE